MHMVKQRDTNQLFRGIKSQKGKRPLTLIYAAHKCTHAQNANSLE